MSFTNLGCNNFGLTDPVTVTLDGNQVATAVTYNLTQQKAAAQAAAGGAGRQQRPAHQAPGRPRAAEPVPYVENPQGTEAR